MIETHDYIECDNGRLYHVVKNWSNNGFDSLLVYKGEAVNEVKSWHINDCYTYNEHICIGELGREFLYTKIVSIYNSVGVLKHTTKNNVRSRLL
ncbi:hypothetical protein D3C87_624570 [compost metagenome]